MEARPLIMKDVSGAVSDTYETRDRWHAAYLLLYSPHPYATCQRDNGRGGTDTWFSFPGYRYHRELLLPFRDAYKEIMDVIYTNHP